MGMRFDLGSTSVVAYLTSRNEEPPRLTAGALLSFLQTLAIDDDSARPRLISFTFEWISLIQDQARAALDQLYDLDLGENQILDANLVKILLRPLANTLGNYDLYVLPVGTWREQDVLDRFAYEAARLPGSGLLALIPDYYAGHQNVTVLDPSDGTREALTRRDLWPGAIFFLRDGSSQFLPLEDAYRRLVRLSHTLSTFGPMEPGRERSHRIADVLAAPKVLGSSPGVRIVHLSDLHLGTNEAAETQTLLELELRKHAVDANHFVISGDLFDQPKRRYSQQFSNFRDRLQMVSGRKPVLVPGNHDQRLFGNSLMGLGRRLRQLTDLRWDSVIVDDDTHVVFLCFDSARSGDFARGDIDRSQLRRVAGQYELENRNNRLNGYLKVAVLHHHPYAYNAPRELQILDPSSWFPKEEFLALEGAGNFLSWCSGRGVSLVLHGHKHIPRLIRDYVAEDEGGALIHPITTVGCGSSLGAGGKPLSFNVVDWNSHSSSWSIDFRLDRGDGQGFRSAAVTTEMAEI